MSAASDPYVKVYYRIADDERFADVYDDDAALATWLRLLILADASWPVSASLPRRASKRALQMLAACGLVEMKAGHRFRIHGMDKEREKRSIHAQKASRDRWASNAPSSPTSNALSNAQTMPLNSAQLRTTQSSSTNGFKNPEEKPFVTLSEEEKEKRRQADRDELMARTMARLGVKP